MKKTVFALTLLVGFSSIPDGAHAAFPLPYTDTVALWLFDEGAGSGIKFNDATTNNNTGAFTGDNNSGNTASFSISFDNQQEKFGRSALNFHPRFSAVAGTVLDSSSLDTLNNNFTVEGWWNLTNSITGSLFPTLISRAGNGSPNNTQWLMGLTGAGRLLVQVFDATTTANVTFTDPNPFTSNAWQHVAFTFASGVVDLYENGSFIGAATNVNVHPSGVGRILIGDDANAGGLGNDQQPWRGLIDEVRLSDIARIPGDGSGTNNFLAWNGSLIPEPAAMTMSLLGLVWVMLPVVRRARR